VTGAVVSTGAAVAVGCVVAAALLVAVGLTVAFFVATGFALFVGADEVGDDEADAEEPVPVVPITEPPAMFIELVVDS
jgi:hypothetical protein